MKWISLIPALFLLESCTSTCGTAVCGSTCVTGVCGSVYRSVAVVPTTTYRTTTTTLVPVTTTTRVNVLSGYTPAYTPVYMKTYRSIQTWNDGPVQVPTDMTISGLDYY